MSEDIKDIGNEEKLNLAHESARNLLSDILLTKATPILDDDGNQTFDENGEPKFDAEKLYLVGPPKLDENGMLTILCMTDPDSDEVVAHTIISGLVHKDEIFSTEPPKEDSGIIGLDGQPLSSDNAASGIIGLDGQELSSEK